ncbi:MAG: LAGLIDADG family homing endonuclease [Tissierellia bacterium]|nr:LAGLIDADG family homing endonuclease [Tissierellia bacterium]
MDYIAGWFDGEGTVHFSKQEKHYLLSFPNTDLKVMEEMNEYFKKWFEISVEITNYHPIRKSDGAYYKITYRMMITRQKDVIRILEYFKDKCITKKELSQIAYDYEINNPRRSNQSWTEEDKKYLIENYKGYGDVVKIAKYFGRTVASTENEVERLGLRKRIKLCRRKKRIKKD